MDKYACLQCGTEFFRSPWHKRVRDGAKFCSRKCRGISTRGKHPWNFKGHKSSSRGYIITYDNGKYKFEHRIIMEKILGRPLEHYEVVHHLNGIKSDNRSENLVLMNKYNHDKYGKNYIEILQEKIRSLERELDVLKVGSQS